MPKRYRHRVVPLGLTYDPEAVARTVTRVHEQGWTLLSTYTAETTVFGILETWEKVRR